MAAEDVSTTILETYTARGGAAGELWAEAGQGLAQQQCYEGVLDATFVGMCLS